MLLQFCGPQLFNLKAFRHMLSRQKVIQQAAEAAYNQFQSVEPSNAEGQELKNAMENLCSVIHYNTEFNGIEGNVLYLSFLLARLLLHNCLLS